MDIEKAKILLIEDDPATSRMYEAKFNLAGIELISATTLQEGMEKVREKPDIVLLDIKLGEEDGFEILKKIKSDRELKKIPVYLLTNIQIKGNEEKALALGAEKFITKTKILPDEITEIVMEKLKKI